MRSSQIGAVPGALRRPVLRALGVLTFALAASGCDDGPIAQEDESTLPVSSAVLLDTTGALPAEAVVIDSFRVVLPANSSAGIIFESDGPIAAGIRGNGILTSPGGTFASVVSDPEDPWVFVGHRDGEPMAVNYRLRVVDVREAPEQVASAITVGSAVSNEWLDPPLDVDVFSVRLDQGERFHVEYESEAEPLTMRIEAPGGATSFVFTESGPERAQSPVMEAGTSGEHLLIIHRSGLVPDVETSYWFRLVPAGETQGS